MRCFLVAVVTIVLFHFAQADEYETAGWEKVLECRSKIAGRKNQKIGEEIPAVGKKRPQPWHEKPIYTTPLVGRGYDNLLSQPLFNIYASTLSRCKTTNDGRYLISDHVKSTDIKELDFDKTAQKFDDHNAYFTATTDSIDLLPDKNIFDIPVDIPGRFSPRYKEVARRIGSKKIFRTQIRYTAYDFSLRSDAQFESAFKDRVRTLSREVEATRTYKAENWTHQENITCKSYYMVQELIRDYGTHYVSGVVMGAEISQDDYVDATIADNDSAAISQAAAANFFTSLKLPAAQDTGKYAAVIQSSKINFKGAMEPKELLDPQFFPDLLVPLDIRGEPLYTLFTEAKARNLNLQETELPRLRQLIKYEINAYYKENEAASKSKVPKRPPTIDAATNVTELINKRDCLNLPVDEQKSDVYPQTMMFFHGYQ